MRPYLRKYLAAGALLGILFLPSAPADAQVKKFKMEARSEFWILAYLEGQFDKKYGIEAEPVTFGTGVEAVEALIGGSIDISSSGHIPIVTMMTKTKNVLIAGLYEVNNGSIYKLIVRKDAPYKTVADLRGKRIATRIGTGPYIAFMNYVKAKGMSGKDFQILNSQPAEIVAALESKSVEGAVWFQPTTSIMLWKGFGRILANFDGHARAQGHWLANRAFAEKNPDTVVRFLAGAFDVQEMLQNNPRVAAQLISKGLARRGRQLPPEVVAIGMDEFDWNPVPDPRVLPELGKAFQFLKAAGRVKGAEPDWAALMPDTYWKKALEFRRKHNKQF